MDDPAEATRSDEGRCTSCNRRLPLRDVLPHMVDHRWAGMCDKCLLYEMKWLGPEEAWELTVFLRQEGLRDG